MENLLKKYFLFVANNPFRVATWLTLAPAVVILVVFGFVFTDGPIFDFAVKVIVAIAFFGYIFLAAINIIIPLIFITYFAKGDRTIVLIRTKDTLVKSLVYQRPIWGKVPYVKIYFPENWNLNDDSLVRETTLGVIVPVINQSLCYIAFKARFSFGPGDFQARDLEEMIWQQGTAGQYNKDFNFKSCLQKIIARKLGDHRELLRDWLLQWQEKAITIKELENNLLQLKLLPPDLFANIDLIELKLLPPDFTSKKLRREYY